MVMSRVNNQKSMSISNSIHLGSMGRLTQIWIYLSQGGDSLERTHGGEAVETGPEGDRVH